MFPVLSRCFLYFLFFLANGVFALPEDNTKKLEITAVSYSFDYKAGINTYEGDVKVDQGTTHLIADKLVTQNNEQHKMKEAIAYGMQKLAEYSTVTKVGETPLHAQAKVIKFYPMQTLVILEGDVIVTQGENSFHGPIIIYNSKDQTVKAPPSKDGRATIVIDSKQII